MWKIVQRWSSIKVHSNKTLREFYICIQKAIMINMKHRRKKLPRFSSCSEEDDQCWMTQQKSPGSPEYLTDHITSNDVDETLHASYSTGGQNNSILLPDRLVRPQTNCLVFTIVIVVADQLVCIDISIKRSWLFSWLTMTKAGGIQAVSQSVDEPAIAAFNQIWPVKARYWSFASLSTSFVGWRKILFRVGS